MVKLAIFSSFDEIAWSLEGARTPNHDRSISFDIWGHISIPLFEIQKFIFFTPSYYSMVYGFICLMIVVWFRLDGGRQALGAG